MKRGNPNPHYYDPEGWISHKGNNTLAEFGAKNQLPCGGHWIVGKDFAFCIEYAADAYLSPFTKVLEFGEGKTQKWPEMRAHLCEVERNWHTLKNRDEVAAELGLTS